VLAILSNRTHTDGVPRVGPAAEVDVVSLIEGITRRKCEDRSLSIAAFGNCLLKGRCGSLRELVIVAFCLDNKGGKVQTSVMVLLVIILAMLRNSIAACWGYGSIGSGKFSLATIARFIFRFLLVDEGTSFFVDNISVFDFTDRIVTCKAGGHSDGVLRNIKCFKLVDKVGVRKAVKEIARAELGLVGNSDGAEVVVGIRENDPGHFRTVPIIIYFVFKGKVSGARVFEVVESVLEFIIVNVYTIVIDTDGDPLSSESVFIPDIDDVDHLKHPLTSPIRGILVESVIGNALFGFVPLVEAQEIVPEVCKLTGLDLDTARVGVEGGVVTGPVAGTVITSFGIEAVEAIAVKCRAGNYVAIDAILLPALIDAIRIVVFRIFAGSVIYGRTFWVIEIVSHVARKIVKLSQSDMVVRDQQ
jgi:hypothetical protein